MQLSSLRFEFEKLTIKDGVKDLAVFEPDGRLGSDVAFSRKMIVDYPNGRFDIE